ncbi:MAG: hypothetical protein MJA82_15050 [Clostridia bacterium]|nr:hypothetical protein [Clostridia bacterium]
MEEMGWKSDKACSKCRERIRQEIIKEIQETCKECNVFLKVVRRDLEKAPRVK